jgi:hypothetical protein
VLGKVVAGDDLEQIGCQLQRSARMRISDGESTGERMSG